MSTVHSPKGLRISDEVHKALRIRAAETGESMGEIAERALRRELGLMALTWQVIEDNSGGLHLAVFEGDDVIYYAYGYERIDDGLRSDLEALKSGVDPRKDAWVMSDDVTDPQAVYDDLTSEEHGYKIVADQDGVYYSVMGAAALRAFRGWQAWIGGDLMGEGGTEEEAIEAAVREYEDAIGYGDEPHLFANRDELEAALDVGIKDDEEE